MFDCSYEKIMNTKRVLVTGGLGFVGTNIIHYLHAATTYRIGVFDRPNPAKILEEHPVMRLGNRVTFHPGDVLDTSSIDQAVKGADYVIHLAALTHARESLVYPIRVFETNVMGTANFLESSRKYGIKRFIQFSSSEVYGNQIRGRPMDESHPMSPVTPYAASKVAGDRLAYAYWVSFRLPVVIVRPFNIYGPYQTPDKMIPLFINRLVRDIPITLYNGGRSRRDFIHVSDVSYLVHKLLTAPENEVCGEVFNIGTGKATTVRGVLKRLVSLLHKHPSLVVSKEDAVTETMNNVGVSNKIRHLFSWKPSLFVSRGLEQTLAWYLANRHWLDQFH